MQDLAEAFVIEEEEELAGSMGPLKLKPNWLRLKVGFWNGTEMPELPTSVGLKNPAAFRSVLRMNS